MASGACKRPGTFSLPVRLMPRSPNRAKKCYCTRHSVLFQLEEIMNRVTKRLELERLEDRALLSTCHVTRMSDAGIGMGFRGDLRYCINKVNANPGSDIIDFHVAGTIQLGSALPDITDDVHIQGPGADLLTVRRNTGGLYRILTIPTQIGVILSGITIANGSAGASPGGGIYNAGSMQLNNTRIIGNQTETNGGGIYNTFSLTGSNNIIRGNKATGFTNNFGGGIHNSGYLALSCSTIADNFAYAHGVGQGGGIYNSDLAHLDSSTISDNWVAGQDGGEGGGIYNAGMSFNLVNSTVSQNRAEIDFSGTGHGGGIYNAHTMYIAHSTIADNTGHALSGGIHNRAGSTLNMYLTIVANNQLEDSEASDLWGTIASVGHNLIGDSIGGAGYHPSDMLDVDPMLGPLADNGGPTQTYALLHGSPAIDADEILFPPLWDQRGAGFPRVVDGKIDIGAFEVQSSLLPGDDGWLALLITAQRDAD